MGQIPGVGCLAQRQLQEQVVGKQPQQNAVEQPCTQHAGLQLRAAGWPTGEVERDEHGTGGINAQVEARFSRRQGDRKPVVADGNRARTGWQMVAALLYQWGRPGAQLVERQVVQ